MRIEVWRLNLLCDHMIKISSGFWSNIFFKVWNNNIENLYIKVRQLLQNKTEYCYYKICQVLQSATDCYYKVRQVLQIVAVITEWDITHVTIVMMVYYKNDLRFYLSYCGFLKKDFTFITLTNIPIVMIKSIFVDTFIMEFFYNLYYYYYYLLCQ